MSLQEVTIDELKRGIIERLKELKRRDQKMDDYLWDIMIKYKEDEKQNNNDQKINQQDKYQISTLIDFDNDWPSQGMCDRGHDCDNFWVHRTIHLKHVCNACKSKEDLLVCPCCCNENGYRYPKYDQQYVWCGECRSNNVNKIMIQMKRDENKSKIIRNVLYSHPSLELDILCGLPKAAAFINTLTEIVNLPFIHRRGYCLYLIDLDNFKGLNSALGHSGADKIIVDIANIFKKYKKQVENREWYDGDMIMKIERMFVYRQGGDEFALIVHSGEHPMNQQRFYSSWKKEINELGNKYLNNINVSQKEKGVSTMRERERKKIFNALKGLEISNNVKKEINNAINKKEFTLLSNTIGISVGMYWIEAYKYRPDPRVTNQSADDWIKGAETAQDQVKELHGKNDIRICIGYYNDETYEEVIDQRWSETKQIENENISEDIEQMMINGTLQLDIINENNAVDEAKHDTNNMVNQIESNEETFRFGDTFSI
eukprot:439885_1